MAYDNTNRGAIWKNREKKDEKHPDFKGSLNVDGVDYWVSAWKRKDDAPNNQPALSFTVKPKDEQTEQPASKPAAASKQKSEDMDDEIPF
jgi:hypothetical protein